MLGILPVLFFAQIMDLRADTPDFRTMIEQDWARQEERRGRTIGDPRSVRDTLMSSERLLAALDEQFENLDLHAERWNLTRCARQVGCVERLDERARKELYYRIRAIKRRLALKNPLLAGRPLVFMKRRRFICQMLHEYIGYYYNYDGLHGGGLYVLEQPGKSLETRDLIGGRLPEGNYATPALSPDGRTIYFAFCKRSQAERSRGSTGDYRGFPAAADVSEGFNYYSENRACFHIYAVNVCSRLVPKGRGR